ncbi:Hpt domain-containing protein [Pseudomonas sp. DWP3-1-2]|uniref:Hpt domain-containing protein n=1 Tax=Pseudomonas sp. DWP3-1-2 TaxID=2804645 RepID=UPI003CEE6435
MEDEYATLLDVFLDDSEHRMTRLRQMLKGRSDGSGVFDLQELSLMAHSFKGSSGNMGALHLADLCRELEERSRREEVRGLEDLLASIDIEYVTVRRLFDAERQLHSVHP